MISVSLGSMLLLHIILSLSLQGLGQKMCHSHSKVAVRELACQDQCLKKIKLGELNTPSSDRHMSVKILVQ